MAGYNHFPEIIEKLHQAEKQIVGETAAHIAEVYSKTAAKDTGFMRGSAYYRTSDTSTYGQGVQQPASSRTGVRRVSRKRLQAHMEMEKRRASLLPEVGAPPDDLTAYAAVAAPYSIFPEYGTRYTSAQPAFHPAVEAERGPFADKLSHIEDYLR